MMKMRVAPIFILVITLAVFSGVDCQAQTGSAARQYGKGSLTRSWFRKSPSKTKDPKVKEPRAVVRAKKEQEKKQKQLKKDNDKAVKAGKSRHFTIQSSSVQERMKENSKENALRDKNRKREIREASRAARKRYK